MLYTLMLFIYRGLARPFPRAERSTLSAVHLLADLAALEGIELKKASCRQLSVTYSTGMCCDLM